MTYYKIQIELILQNIKLLDNMGLKNISPNPSHNNITWSNDTSNPEVLYDHINILYRLIHFEILQKKIGNNFNLFVWHVLKI